MQNDQEVRADPVAAEYKTAVALIRKHREAWAAWLANWEREQRAIIRRTPTQEPVNE